MRDQTCASALTLLFAVSLMAGMLLVLPARGQSSSNFTLQTHRIGAGGGPASSTSFAYDAATGQSAIGPATSLSFEMGLGFIYTTPPFSRAVIPVELATFEAVREGKSTVQLTWTTASEQNNAGFRVQHRTDRGTWEKVGFVSSKADGGTTSTPQSYRFRVEDLTVGTHRFRLKQMDLDGETELHDPVALELRMQTDLRLSAPAPNPVQDRALLTFAVKKKAPATLTLYNVLGQRTRVLYDGTPPPEEAQRIHLDVSDLSAGTYVVRLATGGQTRTQRLMVVR